MIDWSKLAAVISNVSLAVEEIAPVVGVATGPSGVAIAALVSKGAAFVSQAAQAAAVAGDAISSGDLAAIQAADDKMLADDVVMAIQIAAA